MSMAKDGSTTLNIINPDNDGIVSEKERVITLGRAQVDYITSQLHTV